MYEGLDLWHRRRKIMVHVDKVEIDDVRVSVTYTPLDGGRTMHCSSHWDGVSVSTSDLSLAYTGMWLWMPKMVEKYGEESQVGEPS
jgi:hypothetical protein